MVVEEETRASRLTRVAADEEEEKKSSRPLQRGCGRCGTVAAHCGRVLALQVVTFKKNANGHMSKCHVEKAPPCTFKPNFGSVFGDL